VQWIIISRRQHVGVSLSDATPKGLDFGYIAEMPPSILISEPVMNLLSLLAR